MLQIETIDELVDSINKLSSHISIQQEKDEWVWKVYDDEKFIKARSEDYALDTLETKAAALLDLVFYLESQLDTRSGTKVNDCII
ncbi:hypothetical protein H6G33_10135 [Calothrix sp. FACHB-1219]|uniref:hypothetical protein n=1 Tax=unclassified Calothrix TaxID=2619626 RepID=UPI00168841C9|nr:MULTISPECIES: hypothetical protein [unclassified Calothrix]MBD2201706.1 hypothetical protein [Calothrix sp. FACHB-168]MBD2217392.1 hypothetical protein [Calothrix sp. FACHB-1219]